MGHVGSVVEAVSRIQRRKSRGKRVRMVINEYWD